VQAERRPSLLEVFRGAAQLQRSEAKLKLVQAERNKSSLETQGRQPNFQFSKLVQAERKESSLETQGRQPNFQFSIVHFQFMWRQPNFQFSIVHFQFMWRQP